MREILIQHMAALRARASFQSSADPIPPPPRYRAIAAAAQRQRFPSPLPCVSGVVLLHHSQLVGRWTHREQRARDTLWPLLNLLANSLTRDSGSCGKQTRLSEEKSPPARRGAATEETNRHMARCVDLSHGFSFGAIELTPVL